MLPIHSGVMLVGALCLCGYARRLQKSLSLSGVLQCRDDGIAPSRYLYGYLTCILADLDGESNQSDNLLPTVAPPCNTSNPPKVGGADEQTGAGQVHCYWCKHSLSYSLHLVYCARGNLSTLQPSLLFTVTRLPGDNHGTP